MMNVCILCEDSKVQAAREKAKAITNSETLLIGVSPTGEAPATHWFCSMRVNEESYQKLIELQENSTIELSGPKEFLNKWKLKLVK